jgi:RNA polymerase sigma-70 factor (sigma-E family)
VSSFDDYVRGSSTRLFRTAYLLVGEHSAAEDLVQEVLERMYVGWNRIEDPEAYARKALATRAINRWRMRRRRPEVPLGNAHDRPVWDASLAVQQDVLDALGQLPAGQRAVVVLRFFNDLSVEQTATALRCSTGTVKSQTARALPRLRELLTHLVDKE